jgi:hypothetical protein
MTITGRRQYVAGLATLLALTAGCTTTAKHTKATVGDVPTPSGTTASSPTTVATTPKPRPKRTVDPGLSSSAYRAKLAAAAKPLNATLKVIPRNAAVSVLSARFTRAEHAASAAIRILSPVKAPIPARAEHARVVSALGRLDTELGSLATSTSEQDLCAPSAALSSLGRMAGPKSLATAAHALARKGYGFGVTVPTVPAHGSPRPASGTYIKPGDHSGNGQLTINNGSETDAVLTLAVGSRARMSVFVRHGSTYKIPGVDDGTYTVFYAGGADWDTGAGAFARKCQFSRFDKSLAFTTTQISGGIQYSTWDLTLQPVVGGNATTSKVDPKNYPR